METTLFISNSIAARSPCPSPEPSRKPRPFLSISSQPYSVIFPFHPSLHKISPRISRAKRPLLSLAAAAGNSTGVPVTGGVTQIGEREFSDIVLKSVRPVLVEFVAEWCGPCRLISPALDAIAQEYTNKITVVKIDHDSNPNVIEEYKVYGLPTLILFKDGKEVLGSRREGAITKVKLKEYVDALLESIAAI